MWDTNTCVAFEEEYAVIKSDPKTHRTSPHRGSENAVGLPTENVFGGGAARSELC